MGHRITQLREEKQSAKTSTIITLYSALPGAGKTLLATNLVARLAAKRASRSCCSISAAGQRGEALGQCERLCNGNGVLEPSQCTRRKDMTG